MRKFVPRGTQVVWTVSSLRAQIAKAANKAKNKVGMAGARLVSLEEQFETVSTQLRRGNLEQRISSPQTMKGES